MTNNKCDKYIELSKNDIVKDHLDEFLKYKSEKDYGKKVLDFNEWKELLFEYSNKNKIAPVGSVIYKNYAIGMWLKNQKSKINDNNHIIYKELSYNDYVKDNLDNFLKYLQQKDPNKKPLTFEEGKALLFEYCDIYKKMPIRESNHYKNHNILQWLDSKKKRITDNKCKEYLELSQNNIVREYLNKHLENLKKKDPNKKKICFEEGKELLFEYCELNNKIPYGKVIYKNINLTGWLQYNKNKIESNNCKIYSQLAENKIVKENLDNYLNYLNKKDLIIKPLSFEEGKELLFEYCNINNKFPSGKVIYKNHNIVAWVGGQKNRMVDKNCKEYLELSKNPIVKVNIDNYLKCKSEKDPNKKPLSLEEGKMLLFEFCEKFNRTPKEKEYYKSYDLSKWLGHKKTKIINKNSKEYIELSKNKIVQDNLNKYLNKKLNNISE